MTVIFISYRREDTAGHAGRLFDRLREHFGRENVFLDVVGIGAGVDFAETIDKAVGACDVLLAVIGRAWLDCRNKQGQRRLEDPDDFIRTEISSALQRNVLVVPVLVEGAEIPPTDALPEDLKRLTRRQAVELRDSRWDADIEALITALQLLGTRQKEKIPSNTSHPVRSEPPGEEAGRSPSRRALLWGLVILGATLLAVAAIWILPKSQTLEGKPQTASRDDEGLPKLYLLAVGINDYGHPASNRHSSVASAKAMASLFAKQKHKAFSDVEAVVLTESNATQANVLRALKSWARTASPTDLAIAYFSGRSGVFPTDNSPGRYAFMCFDSDYHEPERTGISGKVILDLSADIASPKLVLLDTPTYGGIHPQEARDATPSVEVKRLPALDIMVATWDGEDPETSFGQSPFSKSLLDALGMAADTNHDDAVTFDELWDYMLLQGGNAALTTPLEFREFNSRTVLVRRSPPKNEDSSDVTESGTARP